MKKEIVVIAGKRTPFGAFGGSLKDISLTELATHAAKATIKQGAIKPEDIDHVVFGNVVQSTSDSAYLSRHVALKSELPIDTPAFGVNRLCGSGFQSWICAAQMIELDEATTVLAGGSEQMSQIPYINNSIRWGLRMGNNDMVDLLSAALTDAYAQIPMAITAENLAEKYDLSRNVVDEYALTSQQRYNSAKEKGYYQDELAPITIKTRKGEMIVDNDEHPKPNTTMEILSKLKPVFKKEGVVTAGNASGIVDGAAATLITSRQKAEQINAQPMCQIISWASVGCDPKIMGIGPVKAMNLALERAQLKFSDMDIIEVNEAFSAQYLAVEKESKLDRERTNVNGGSIAVGHPLGATGTRIMNHLMYELKRRNGKYAMGSACIGGGQGIAIIIKNL